MKKIVLVSVVVMMMMVYHVDGCEPCDALKSGDGRGFHHALTSFKKAAYKAYGYAKVRVSELYNKLDDAKKQAFDTDMKMIFGGMIDNVAVTGELKDMRDQIRGAAAIDGVMSKESIDIWDQIDTKADTADTAKTWADRAFLFTYSEGADIPELLLETPKIDASGRKLDNNPSLPLADVSKMVDFAYEGASLVNGVIESESGNDENKNIDAHIKLYAHTAECKDFDDTLKKKVTVKGYKANAVMENFGRFTESLTDTGLSKYGKIVYDAFVVTAGSADGYTRDLKHSPFNHQIAVSMIETFNRMIKIDNKKSKITTSVNTDKDRPTEVEKHCASTNAASDVKGPGRGLNQDSESYYSSVIADSESNSNFNYEKLSTRVTLNLNRNIVDACKAVGLDEENIDAEVVCTSRESTLNYNLARIGTAKLDRVDGEVIVIGGKVFDRVHCKTSVINKRLDFIKSRTDKSAFLASTGGTAMISALTVAMGIALALAIGVAVKARRQVQALEHVSQSNSIRLGRSSSYLMDTVDQVEMSTTSTN